jgi:hypothetical protein
MISLDILVDVYLLYPFLFSIYAILFRDIRELQICLDTSTVLSELADIIGEKAFR